VTPVIVEAIGSILIVLALIASFVVPTALLIRIAEKRIAQRQLCVPTIRVLSLITKENLSGRTTRLQLHAPRHQSLLALPPPRKYLS
jgi:hypothetical protein